MGRLVRPAGCTAGPARSGSTAAPPPTSPSPPADPSPRRPQAGVARPPVVHSARPGPASGLARGGHRRVMATVVERVWRGVRRWLLAAADLVLPSRCAACHARRRAAVPARAPMPCARRRRAVGPGGVALRPAPPAMPPCWAGARFEGAAAARRHRLQGRGPSRPARRPGSAARGGAHRRGGRPGRAPAARRWGRRCSSCRCPTSRASRRRRGDDPVGELARSATAAVNGRAPAGAPERTVRWPAGSGRSRRGARARAHPPGGRPGAPRPRGPGRATSPARWRSAAPWRGVVRGRHLRARRRRRHDRCDPRRGGPRTARRRGPTRGRGDVRHDTSPLTGPALVAHRTSD